IHKCPLPFCHATVESRNVVWPARLVHHCLTLTETNRPKFNTAPSIILLLGVRVCGKFTVDQTSTCSMQKQYHKSNKCESLASFVRKVHSLWRFVRLNSSKVTPN